MTITVPDGVSDAAEILTRVCSDESKRRGATVTFSNHSLLDQLIDVFQQSSEATLQEDDVLPVEKHTLQTVKHLIESLPLAYQTPTIEGEPDGNVMLEWYVHPRCILTVSVEPSGILHWAALVGEEDPRGSCRFYGKAPETLLYWIDRVCRG